MEYAHIHVKDAEVYCVYYSNENTDHTSQSVPNDCVLTIIEHLDTTMLYEMIDNVITPVTQQDMMDRMNDPDNTTVVIPE